MAGSTDIMIISLIGIGAMVIYGKCIVAKECGEIFGGKDPPDVGGTIPPSSGGSCSGGYIKVGNACACNPQVKGCASGSSCLRMTNTSCTCYKAGTSEVGSASGCNSGQYRCKLSNGACGCCTSGGSTGACPKEYVRVGSSCVCNPTVKKCTASQVTVLVDGNCRCKNCPVGQKRGGNGNQCVAITGGPTSCQSCYIKSGNVCKYSPGSGAAWIARVANAMLYRMCNSCNKVPSISQIANGWPSLTQQCAVDNSCSLNKLHTSYSVFNKHFATLLLTIRGSYAIPISGFAQGELSNQNNTGIWRLTPWAGGVSGFYTQTQASFYSNNTRRMYR